MAAMTRDRWIGAALAAAVFLQGVNLLLLGRLSGRPAIQVLAVTAALALVTHEAWRFRMRLNHRVDMLLVMGAFGGLGMIIGWWIDLGFEPKPANACSGCYASGPWWTGAFTWMTALMLVAAIPPGVLWTRCASLATGNWRRWISTHVIGNVVMVVGMLLVGRWLGSPLAALMGSVPVAHHTAMMLGMLGGMEIGMFAGEAVFGLKPWHDLSFGASATELGKLS